MERICVKRNIGDGLHNGVDIGFGGLSYRWEIEYVWIPFKLFLVTNYKLFSKNKEIFQWEIQNMLET